MQLHSLRTSECIDEIISLYSDMVYRLAFSHTGSRHDADDIYQEVFIRLINFDTAFVSEEHRKAWLIKVTINCCNKLWSSAWRRRAVLWEEESNTETKAFEIPEETALFYALQKLPAEYRVAIHLFYYEELSIREIAQILNEKESTIRSRLTRSRKKLKSLLKEE